MTSGPLVPGPKPWATRSYARRSVRLTGSEPSSGRPTRRPNTGSVAASSNPAAPSAYGTGCRLTWPIQRRHPSPGTASAAATRRRTSRRDRMSRPSRPARARREPAAPRKAGSSVTEATTMIRTMIETASPPTVMNRTFATAMPRIDTTTVPPANTTGRPAVATARPAASWGSTPRARYSRCRASTNSA